MPRLRAIGAAMLVILSLAASQPASAQRVNYGSQTTANVTVFYFDLPPGTQLYLRNEVSGAEVPVLLPLLSGTGSISVPFSLPPGPYQLNVLARQAGAWVAQSVTFYIFI
jgi:hypothetical protein